MVRKNVLSTALPPTTGDTKRPKAPAPRGAVGALQSSLSKLQENAVQEIDATQIDDAGVEDRLGHDHADHTALMDSLKTYGQQVPVLLRPHATKRGRFEIVYGRRRLRALKELGQPVKAMVRQLSDDELIMAQGQENTARRDLSFVEKASFAAQLEAEGYDRDTIAAALSIDQPMVSRMLKVGQAVPLDVLRKIGPAPSIGRDRWLALVKLFDAKGARNRAFAFLDTPDASTMTSDNRFEAIFARAKAPSAKATADKQPPRALRNSGGTVLGDIRPSRKGVTLNISDKDGFAQWLDAQADTLIAELHDRWSASRSEDEEQ
ncbi:plasmid partitioning protein RepB [uncultured Tateyamaria sp.]|uniref:plasmid partitioning protein RepB n=1 Tax=uncultured Tateyamaria sp. TaxID=455651 RepID=UPI002636DFF0|nr:plasmid partitioning protein RepB [uncultured Tateyamaria sp.]